MEPKKNPKADLSKRSVLFFQLGLILILGLSYLAIEWKTYEKEAIDIGQLQMDDMLEEDVPITELNTPPPPPPPAIKTISGAVTLVYPSSDGKPGPAVDIPEAPPPPAERQDEGPQA